MRRFRWIDVLVAVSCLAVVSLHVDGAFWDVHVRHWWLLSIYLLHGYVVYRLCPAIGIPDDAVWFRVAGALVVVPVLIVAIRLIRKIPAAKVLLP